MNSCAAQCWHRKLTRRLLLPALVLCCIFQPHHLHAQILLVPPTAPWRFFDSGRDPGPGWQLPDFNDRQWITGLGPFGYGEGFFTTLVQPGPNLAKPYTTTYFRHVFNAPPPPPGAQLNLHIRRDDGVVAYLNANEVHRDNLPPAVRISYNTPASQEAADDGRLFTVVPIKSSLLREGPNVLAVEVHQAESDLPPDLTFEAFLSLDVPPPPIFELHPQCLTAFLGTNVQFLVLAVGATHYQWFHNGLPLPNATNSTLALTNLQRSHAGEYVVHAMNPQGTSVSQAGQLQIELTRTGVIRNELIARDFLSLSGVGPALASIPSGCQPPIFSLSLGSGYSYNTYGSSAAAGETNHCGIQGGRSMWSIYLAPATERIILRTEGSDFDTLLAVYTWDGNDRHPLDLIACDDNGGPNLTSRVEFDAVAGKVYFIVVDGVMGATGNVRLQIGGLLLGKPISTIGRRLDVPLSGRRPQDRIYTLRISSDPLAPAAQWKTVFSTNVPANLGAWAFLFSTNLPQGSPRIFFQGTEAP